MNFFYNKKKKWQNEFFCIKYLILLDFIFQNLLEIYYMLSLGLIEMVFDAIKLMLFIINNLRIVSNLFIIIKIVFDNLIIIFLILKVFITN